MYNLTEERMEEDRRKGNQLIFDGRPGHSACYDEQENKIIFYGGGGSNGYENAACNPAMHLREDGGNLIAILVKLLRNDIDGLLWEFLPGLEGPGMPSPTSQIYENKLFMHQPCEENGHFGRLFIYEIGIFIYEDFVKNNLERGAWEEYRPERDHLSIKFLILVIGKK